MWFTSFPRLTVLLAQWGLLAGLLFPASLVAETTLRYKFKAGDKLHYEMTQSMAMEMQLPQQPEPLNNVVNQKMYIELETLEVLADGSARQRQAITRIVLSVDVKGGPVAQSLKYDSDSKEEPTGPLAQTMIKALKPMIGAEWLQTMSPRGEVLEVEIPEKFANSLKSNPGAAMMGNLGSAEGLKQLSSQAAMSFPEAPLKAEESWDQTIELKMPFGLMKTKKTTTYIGPQDNGLELLKLDTAMEFEPGEKSPVVLKVIDNDAEGQVLFDNRLGRMQGSKLHQVTKMEITSAGQTINQTVTTDVAFELAPETAGTAR